MATTGHQAIDKSYPERRPRHRRGFIGSLGMHCLLAATVVTPGKETLIHNQHLDRASQHQPLP